MLLDTVKLEAKSDAAIALLEVITVWETRQERQLKTLRTNEGKEFDNECLNSELKRKGVEHQMTTRYTPQSNGRAERVNRTLLQCVRTMLVAARCPRILWDEALLMKNECKACHPVTSNRSLKGLRDPLTPVESRDIA
jgi:transposase InsO family protein